MNVRLITFLVAVLAAVTGVVRYLETRLQDFYIFDTDELHKIALQAIDSHGNDTRAVVADIVTSLQSSKAAPYLSTEERWIFNNAGGAMGGMYIIHASITEYLIIFGTAVGTEGTTGRHTADDYFYILRGAELTYTRGKYEAEVYSQGMVNHLVRGDVKQYKMETTCFALEYARGWIPPMLFFGFADGLTSTLDFPTLWETTWFTGQQMIGNLLIGKM